MSKLKLNKGVTIMGKYYGTLLPEEIAKRLVDRAKAKRECSVCRKKIVKEEVCFSLPKGGYGYWRICMSCLDLIIAETKIR
jgi:hypothetical protein